MLADILGDTSETRDPDVAREPVKGGGRIRVITGKTEVISEGTKGRAVGRDKASTRGRSRGGRVLGRGALMLCDVKGGILADFIELKKSRRRDDILACVSLIGYYLG